MHNNYFENEYETMTIEFKLDEKDFLNYQLYTVSKSERVKKKRRKSKLIFPLIYLLFGILSYFQDKVPLTIIFIVIGILWYLIYPYWEKRHYVRHYKGFIKENYKDRLDRMASIQFDNDCIITKDDGSESKLLYKEIEEINEIPETIFIKLRTAQSFILPKGKIKNVEILIDNLKELAIKLNIKYNIEDNWKWK